MKHDTKKFDAVSEALKIVNEHIMNNIDENWSWIKQFPWPLRQLKARKIKCGNLAG